MKRILLLLVAVGRLLVGAAQSQPTQQTKPSELKYSFGPEGKFYFKATAVNQAWLRYTWNNPGTTIGGTPQFQSYPLVGRPEAQTFDIGLRRTRIQLFGQLSEHVFFYAQLGQNNFSYLAPRKFGFFLHDAVSEYYVNKHLSWGAGLTGWTGFSRFSSPGVISILGADAPLFLQATNDANDQFLRKLSTYIKGKIGNLDYRVVLSKPFDIASALNNPTAAIIGNDSKFSLRPPKWQGSGYINYQFLDEESNLTPYQTGTYLGTKRVLNIGGGLEYQPKAMWNLNGTDTIEHAMLLAALEVYYDAPLNTEKGTAVSVYAVVTHYDFGPRYIRAIGVMNPADGTSNTELLPGSFGNAFPMIGSGNSGYIQIGYVLPHNEGKTRLQPYGSCQYSRYEKLKDPMLMWEGGVAVLFNGHSNKITIGYQNRPVFGKDNASEMVQNTRKGMLVVQYQAAIF
jgi:hypothetical protein